MSAFTCEAPQPVGRRVPIGSLGGVAVAAAAVLSVLLVVCPLAAQESGSITGRVVVATTQQPLGSVQIYLTGTERGTLTQDNGRFVLLSVPPGEYTVTAERIGYRTGSRTVTVTAGGTQVVNFELQEEVLGLDEIVVTGEAGSARRREVGNSIAQINLSQIAEPVVNAEALIQGRASGVMISEAIGAAGAGSYIRLRGNVSVAMSNQPLVYVDGVRIYSEPYPVNNAPDRGNSSGVAASALNTVNPSDIERIEIIKGAAATTLYGTEAAAGVIQIFTKSGSRTGEPRWNLESTYLVRHMLEYGVEGFPYLRMEPWLKEAFGHRQDLSVRGGVGDFTYFLSGQYKNEDNVLPNDNETAYAIRGNLGFRAFGTLNVQWNTSFSRQDIQNTSQTNSSAGLPLNVYRGDRNYVGSDDPEKLRPLLDYELTSKINHLITGMTVRYQPTADFTHRLTAGYDFSFIEHRNFKPFGFLTDPQGILYVDRWSSELLTVDYAGSYSRDLGSRLSNTFSWGGQIVDQSTGSVTGWSQGFPGPGRPTLSSGASQITGETRIRVVNAGFFFQNRLGVDDRLFFTAGLRVDGNSAFGEALGLEPYPKLSASYILSDAGFWKPAWGQMKLRAAWGQSGRAPGAFDAVKTWQPIRHGDRAGFLPQNLGNPELGPERTSEFEVGFDGSWFEQRLSTEFTYYYRRTTDALFPVSQIPSTGQWSAQLENVGELEGRGIELALNGSIIESPDLEWDLGFTASTAHTKVLDLGKASIFVLPQGPGYIIPGEPAPVVRAQIVTNPDELAKPNYELHNYGPNFPTTILGQTFRLRWRGLTLSGRGEFQGGHYIFSRLEEGDVQRNTKWPPCFPVLEKGVENMTALERSRCIPREVKRNYFIYKGDFWKLRDVTLQVPIGFLFPAWAENATLTLSARNALKWTDMPYFDPEMAGQHAQADPVRSIRDNVPPPAVYSAAIRVSF